MRLDHNNADGSNANQEAGSQSPSTDDTLPPEDSFERFLMDLQVDLRRTLSEDVVQDEAEAPSQTSDPATASQSPADEERSDLLPWPTASNNLAEENTAQPQHAADPTGEGNQRPSADDAEVDDPTAREDSSDSDSDDEDRAIASLADHEPQPGAPSAAPQPPPQVPHSRTASGSERRPGGGINWWRLYRFPPQHAPNAQGHGLLPPSSAALDSDSVPSGMPTPSGTDTPASASGDAPPAGENMIVPVILVGLQSVIGRSTPEQNAYLHGDAPDGDSAGDDGGVDSEYGDDERSVGGAPRGRPWRSRAADAFRGLRPGRRGEAANGPQAGETGSTTFFIYVIGGYYPPNHHLVTGNDPLDSFEALWELAEMLGQVKPPTATREDIAKSGLEVIRPSDLEQYENDGRVSSNCVERCLICLEEYAPEEDLRLMTCRHLFHKTCVDRWLQTGRNNCPACRSQGVSTGPGATETPTTG
ncbi:hypothetical protein HETIRDRAFT_440169 [Heterobasidion irregulare TC 32-1]|uniref:RING-type E3 ubiquitin transferase n=1 Tax=Heterobasidion irregulare (strain TC 32-1) TaxID=747525 RepID=W4K8M4_HETIT|nr:uncharacterized protein HETIRDRAFT_440169 [Heterobasidion irregulare TC 32-1]ETW82104.1 hypothetical protein HETIRDRAFT_440169 [Heterobasidion irregulare TC 32-1]